MVVYKYYIFINAILFQTSIVFNYYIFGLNDI